MVNSTLINSALVKSTLNKIRLKTGGVFDEPFMPTMLSGKSYASVSMV